MPRIVQLLASPVHRYVGRPADGPAPAPFGELVEQVRLRAGLGVVGDRYFGRPAHRTASVTLVAQESLPAGVDLTQLRRNVLTSGVPVDELVGRVLTLDSGDGPVSLRVHRAAPPCAWLDVVVAPGTWKALRRRAGVRGEPLTDGVLRVGPVSVTVGD
ncbi:molybdenum cofactor biosysynthesis protein [Micromonospora sp. WMMD980]|uniref:molybdenum cofactor biosysynthesis protein n=1 Tax=Micromonospora sp. WMMD980 TaxID=3016088 RepID=UPI0024164D97|nr:molybdenum cofactor biosysynthesis protein [Micromonospora sp. WMMD980]MDG4801044.1 molybdenum cofactor biosysynthesis protein [Micromonospora sp. WMMD980]